MSGPCDGTPPTIIPPQERFECNNKYNTLIFQIKKGNEKDKTESYEPINMVNILEIKKNSLFYLLNLAEVTLEIINHAMEDSCSANGNSIHK